MPGRGEGRNWLVKLHRKHSEFTSFAHGGEEAARLGHCIDLGARLLKPKPHALPGTNTSWASAADKQRRGTPSLGLQI